MIPISMTQTAAIPAEMLHLNRTIKSQVSSLLEKMEVCPYISPQLQEKVQELKREYEQVSVSKESLALALGILAVTVLNPACIEYGDNREIQDVLLELYDDLLNILGDLIPNDETPADFIKMCNALVIKERKFEEEVKKIQETFADIQRKNAEMMRDWQEHLKARWPAQHEEKEVELGACLTALDNPKKKMVIRGLDTLGGES